MLKAIQLRPKTLAYVICGLILGEPLRWTIGKALDWAYARWGVQMIDAAAKTVDRVQPYFLTALISMFTVILLANWRVVARVIMRIFIKDCVFEGGAIAGVSGKAATVHMDGVTVINPKKAIELSGAPDSTFKDTTVVGGQMPDSVGFDVINSPGIKMGNAKSKNYAKGFRIDSSPAADLSQATAEMDAPPVKPNEP